MQDKTAIIIGSGVAGLAIATRLTLLGYRVSVYEKNPLPGGKIGKMEHDGYTFDSGPSLFTEPQNIEEIFALASEPIDDYLRYRTVNIACKYFYENGIEINGYTDRERFVNELKDKVDEKPADIIRYLSDAERAYENIGSIFFGHSLHKSGTWLHPRIFNALKTVRFAHLFKTLNSYNCSRIKSPEARQLFNRFATYNGSDPYKAPGMLSMISHLEHNKGVFYPYGGMISISNALYRLALKKGVQFFFNCPVERIIHHEGIVRGIVVEEKNIMADIVVSNADIYFTYKNLLCHSKKAGKVVKSERSSSALIFYWGINKIIPSLELHNVFFSANYEQEFSHIFAKKTISKDPTVYINITSKMEEGHSPENKENWFVMVNAPAHTGQDWQSIQQQARTNIIGKLSRMLKVDLAEYIETEDIVNPEMLEESTGSYQGSLYGSSSNSRMAAFSRPPNFINYIKNLYFCGGSVHPGGGIPLCLKSAKIASGLIKDCKIPDNL